MTSKQDDQRSRLVILTTSSRVSPGLLSADAWDLVRNARVFAASHDHVQIPALRKAGVEVEIMDGVDGPRLMDHAANDTVVWLASPDGDPALADALARASAARVERGTAVPMVETIAGAHDAQGARLLDLVDVMDRLRSPGGCPWDAQQTHSSLATYLLEETYETLEAIESGDDTHLREELGDLLLQVLFHARIAQEKPAGAWSIDDVAAGIVDKLVQRHPHVFGDEGGDTGPWAEKDAEDDAEHVAGRWELIKRAEKGRTSAVDGVPMAQPALALAAKLLHRTEKLGVEVPMPDVNVPKVANAAEAGDTLMAMVVQASRVGVDAEQALRGAVRRYIDAVKQVESGE